MLILKKIDIITIVIITVICIVISLFCVLFNKTHKNKISANKKTNNSQEKTNLKQEKKVNDTKIKTILTMLFIDKFKLFIETLGIDYEKFAEEKFETKDKTYITLNDINASNIKNFDWANFLAKKHELILIDNNQETLESLTEFEKYKGGYIKKYLKENKLFKLGYYRDDIKTGDFERFEYAKDIRYFLADVCGNISCHRSTLSPIYIETENPDTFLFGIYINKKESGYTSINDLKSLANAIGLYVFVAGCDFPKTRKKTTDNNFIEINEINVNKNYVQKTRNDKLITEIKENKKLARQKALEEFLNKQQPNMPSNDNFVPITHGFRCEDEIECYIYGEKHKIKVSSIHKTKGELLDKEEIDEVNWLATSNMMDNREIQFKVLEKINDIYDMALGEGVSKKTNLKREFTITTILIDTFANDNSQKADKIIAFCGEAKCDTEHGLSVSFANRKFAGVGSFMDFNNFN